MLKKTKNQKTVIKLIPVVVIVCAVFCFCLYSHIHKSERVIRYSVYPYIVNVEYYKECIEEEWNKLHPDIKLQAIDYNCYHDGKPEGVDVIMYDAILESHFVDAGYITGIDESAIDNIDDFFDYTLEDIKKDGTLYGIPAFLCSDFYIYDKEDSISENAKTIYDLKPVRDEVLIHDVKYSNYSLILDAHADQTGRYVIDEEISDSEKLIDEIKEFGNQEYFDKDAYALAAVYDSGVGVGYFGYSETLSSLKNRFPQTSIKMLSYSESENIPLFYQDVVALSTEVTEQNKKSCIELMNLMTSGEMMEKLAENEGSYSYLIFPRNSMYADIIQKDDLYARLYGYVSNENNHIIRHPASLYMEQ